MNKNFQEREISFPEPPVGSVYVCNHDPQNEVPLGFVLGPPHATAPYTVEQLQGWGLAGLYRLPESNALRI